jgi:hypothetical protein
VVYNAAYFDHRPVSRPSCARPPARDRRELPRATPARAPLRSRHGRTQARRHRAHDVPGRLARWALDCLLRCLQGLQSDFGRGAVGRAGRKRRSRHRLSRRGHAHARLRILETAPEQSSPARSQLRCQQDPRGLGSRPQRRARRVLPLFGFRHGPPAAAPMAIRIMGRATRKLYG